MHEFSLRDVGSKKTVRHVENVKKERCEGGGSHTPEQRDLQTAKRLPVLPLTLHLWWSALP